MEENKKDYMLDQDLKQQKIRWKENPKEMKDGIAQV